MDIEEELARAINGGTEDWLRGDLDTNMPEFVAAALMPLVRRAQAEALRSYRTRLMDQNIDRFGIVLPDLNEVLDDLDEEADRIEQEAGA